MERERKFLVDRLPDELGPAVRLRQGYLALDGDVEVRVRDAAGERTLTVKQGEGRDRVEVELPLDGGDFDELWPLTEHRRVEKDRYRVDLGDGLTAEVDRYDGLDVVEVEFDDRDPDGWRPPDWFGAEVTDDRRYDNATIALRGLPRP
jgi:CYTH domain-containing protein